MEIEMQNDASLFGKPYLGDARLDRLMGIVFSLAGEVAVLKAEVMRLAAGAAASDTAIQHEIHAFAREVLKPLTDPDFATTKS